MLEDKIRNCEHDIITEPFEWPDISTTELFGNCYTCHSTITIPQEYAILNPYHSNALRDLYYVRKTK